MVGPGEIPGQQESANLADLHEVLDDLCVQLKNSGLHRSRSPVKSSTSAPISPAAKAPSKGCIEHPRPTGDTVESVVAEFNKLRTAENLGLHSALPRTDVEAALPPARSHEDNVELARQTKHEDDLARRRRLQVIEQMAVLEQKLRDEEAAQATLRQEYARRMSDLKLSLQDDEAALLAPVQQAQTLLLQDTQQLEGQRREEEAAATRLCKQLYVYKAAMGDGPVDHHQLWAPYLVRRPPALGGGPVEQQHRPFSPSEHEGGLDTEVISQFLTQLTPAPKTSNGADAAVAAAQAAATSVARGNVSGGPARWLRSSCERQMQHDVVVERHGPVHRSQRVPGDTLPARVPRREDAPMEPAPPNVPPARPGRSVSSQLPGDVSMREPVPPSESPGSKRPHSSGLRSALASQHAVPMVVCQPPQFPGQVASVLQRQPQALHAPGPPPALFRPGQVSAPSRVPNDAYPSQVASVLQRPSPVPASQPSPSILVELGPSCLPSAHAAPASSCLPELKPEVHVAENSAAIPGTVTLVWSCAERDAHLMVSRVEVQAWHVDSAELSRYIQAFRGCGPTEWAAVKMVDSRTLVVAEVPGLVVPNDKEKDVSASTSAHSRSLQTGQMLLQRTLPAHKGSAQVPAPLLVEGLQPCAPIAMRLRLHASNCGDRQKTGAGQQQRPRYGPWGPLMTLAMLTEEKHGADALDALCLALEGADTCTATQVQSSGGSLQIKASSTLAQVVT
eukprot:gnl/TRDRNA2_/TRDRNA2_85968_c0_seq1.p1 gnl/TRDRNA2_/TRDRNA2_85968_c0~~gnl/TRDRNA2_/TRDRNA2_85968_c0_seq1.p1  ORF type:complete len:733 (+),score=131.71 gnl/TRDRNA2_/TRDRNA2_85968_c0_seq1:59-2257(+)